MRTTWVGFGPRFSPDWRWLVQKLAAPQETVDAHGNAYTF